MKIDFSKVKFGRPNASPVDSRTLMFSDYRLPATLPVHPASYDWSHGITNWGMLGNDKYGDCTIAGFAHAIMVWCANHGINVTFTVAQALDIYAEATGFDLGTDANDNGATLLQILKYVSANTFAEHKLAAYVQVDPTNPDQIREALYLCGVLYAGFAVPSTIEGENGVWDVTDPNAKIVGGHCVPFKAYKPGIISCVTWGEDQDITDRFISTYFDEVWAPISLDWVSPAMTAPNSFNFTQLMADRSAL